MTDDDRTPPPDEPRPAQSRDRIRSGLLAAAQDGRETASRRWLVPAAATAAVVVVAGLAGWAVRAGGDDGGDPPVTAPSSTPTSVATDPVPSEPTVKATLTPSTCVDPMGPTLPGAQLAVTFPAGGDGGETTVWVAGDSFAVCDVRAGTTTVLKPVSMRRAHGVAPYRVSSIYPPTRDGYRTIRVAAGLVPDGVMAFDVRYTFPDGHTEAATTTEDDQGRTWWRMVYAYDDGGANELQQPPIEVTVGYSGVEKSYTLAWGVDTCAQANHGC